MQQNYNKKNKGLALLGQGKWKSALRSALVLMGIVLGLGGMNVWAQDQIPDALKLDKKFYPTDPMGHTGVLWLETFTTGDVKQETISVPTDIVLVLDASTSMTTNSMSYGGTSVTRLRALQMAVREFIGTIYQDAVNHNCDHRIAVVSFSTEDNIRLLSIPGTPSGHTVTSFTTGDYQDALVPVLQYESLANLQSSNRLGNGLTGSSSNWNTGRIYQATGNGTAMHRGLQAAYGVLDARRQPNGGGEFFTVSETSTQMPRNMVVVFFTDGYPGNANFNNTNYWPQSTTSNGNVVGWANQAVQRASDIKEISVTNPSGGAAAIPTIYSIGVTTGANPAANYTVEEGTYTTGSGWNQQNIAAYLTGTKCFNALLHFISSDYSDRLPNWSTPARNSSYGGTLPNGAGINLGFYKAAADATQLSTIFKEIASASGGTEVQLGSDAVVQDVISASFKLPDGATINDIKVYAPMLKRGHDVLAERGMTRKNADSPWEYHFEDTISSSTNLNPELPNYDPLHKDYAGRLVLDTETGHITDSTYENRINSSDVVTIDPDDRKTISFTHFDFKHYYCGPIIEHGDTIGYVGRKLVMIIPIEIEEGTWGDGIETNTELSFVTPDEQIHWQFPIPGATVVGDVWTEIITQEPAGYADDDINSPEDLAWFISRVNGRAGYLHDNNVASNPTLPGKLTADIDMSAHNWVPIGAGYKCDNQGRYLDADGNIVWGDDAHTFTIPTVNLAYEGVFDGNGHVITGLKNNATKYYKLAHAQDYQVLVYPGMFSNVKGNGTTTGVVKNVFVLNSDFHARNHERDMETFIHFGIIADTLTGGAIYNCEAVGRIDCNNDYVDAYTHEIDYTQIGRDSEMIVAGLVGLNNGGTIHSSMAMAELTGYSMGGMVGEMRNGAVLANSFTNGVYNYLGTRGDLTSPDTQGLFRYSGGLVARNHDTEEDGTTTGTVKNCYVRFERTNSYGSETSANSIKFGQFVGTNVVNPNVKGTIQYCYYPSNNTINQVADDPTANPGNYYSNPVQPSSMRYSRSSDNMVGGSLVSHTYGQGDNQETVNVLEGGTTMVDVLNEKREGYAEWKRTTAGDYVASHNGGNINGDFPVLKLTGFNCIASTDGIGLDYAKNLDQMLQRHNTGNMNVGTSIPITPEDPEDTFYHGHPQHNYNVTEAPALYGGTINLYGNDDTSMGTMSITTQDGKTVSTVVYIDENISLLQSTLAEIDAYTGQYIIDYGATSDPQSGNRWHNVSSSLKSSMFGWGYHITEQVPHHLGNGWDSFKSSWDANNPNDVLTSDNPCKIWLTQGDEDHELFPNDMASSHPMDFYCFFEPEYHWINFKRKGDSHWHMDNYEQPIAYYYNQPNEDFTQFTQVEDNETQFIPGKGYLLALHTEYFQWGEENMHLWTESESAKKDRTFLQNRGTLNNGDVNIPVTYTAENEWTGLAGYNLLGNPYQSYLDFDEFVTGNPSLWGGSDTYAQTYAVFSSGATKEVEDPEDPGQTITVNEPAWLQYKKGTSKGANTADRYINMHQGFFIQTSQTTTAYFTNVMRTNDATPNFRGPRPAYPLINFELSDCNGSKDIAVLEVGRPENDGAMKLRVGSATGRISLRHDNTDFGILFSDMTEGSQPLRFETEEDGTFTLSWNTANANFSSLTLVDNITGVNYDMLAHDSYEFEGRASDYKSRFKILIGEFTDVEDKGQLTVTDVMGRMVYTDNLTNDQNRVSLNGLSQGVYLMQVRNGNGAKVQKIVVR